MDSKRKTMIINYDLCMYIEVKFVCCFVPGTTETILKILSIIIENYTILKWFK